jgi:membrane dipeptidase
MVTFVPSFIAPECRDWENGLSAEMERRGMEPWDWSLRPRVRQEWVAGHPRPVATLAQVASHVEHVREVAGIDHVGIGSDFDGTDQVPEGLADVSCYPALIAELLGRGWSQEDCRRLAGGNILRVMREAEAAARAIGEQRGPSTARIS